MLLLVLFNLALWGVAQAAPARHAHRSTDLFGAIAKRFSVFSQESTTSQGSFEPQTTEEGFTLPNLVANNNELSLDSVGFGKSIPLQTLPLSRTTSFDDHQGTQTSGQPVSWTPPVSSGQPVSGTPPVSSGQPASGVLTSEQQDMLTAHNDLRNTRLDTPLLTWSPDLADRAEEWSEHCLFRHSGGPDGENLAQGYPNAIAGINAWARELASYDPSHHRFDEVTGHLTQMLWANTTSLGCHLSSCNKMFLLVCKYYPAGNVDSPEEFIANVKPAKQS